MANKEMLYWVGGFLGTTVEEMDSFDGLIVRDAHTGKAIFCVYDKPNSNLVSVYEAVEDARGYDMSDEMLLASDISPFYAHAVMQARIRELKTGSPFAKFIMERDAGYRAGYCD